MIGTELDAAGISDPLLRASYQRCRELNAAHGRTYYLATRLLSSAQRPPVHALYALARLADDIVDVAPPGTAHEELAARLDRLTDDLNAGLRSGVSSHPVLAAVIDTVARYRIDATLFGDFLAAMRMDLTVTDYPDRAALDAYMYGSAEVVGLQVLPVLGTVVPVTEAAPHAAALGKAFQLTNFLRDVSEDLDRGRVYLPADELAAYGVDRARLEWCRAHRTTDQKVRAALAEQHAITRSVYAYAKTGIVMLDRTARPCVTTAFTLYGEILDRIEVSGFAVFAHRARVGRLRRLRVAGPALARALWARRGGRARPPAIPVREGAS
jgi:15-cis-phytoene synthase